MNDIYLYEDVPVLKNKLRIKDSESLDLIEAEQSRMNMMLLYEKGITDFSAEGLQYIHRYLFGDLYDWAGSYRMINIQKREEILAGLSVWYSNDDDIVKDLESAFNDLRTVCWKKLSREQFVSELARVFSVIWKVHPFREGNTRTVVMMMTLFVESYGYYMDQELLTASAGYVRNSFVMASIGEHSEYEHLERILLDAVCTEPIEYSEHVDAVTNNKNSKYTKYQKESYQPKVHEQRPDDYKHENYKM